MPESITNSESHPSTSSTLLRDALQGDRVAWEAMTATYGRVVYRWIRRAGVRADDASDVMQEVFLSVYRGLATYDRPYGPFRNWLFVVTRNATINHWRRQTEDAQGEGGTSAWERQCSIPAPEVPHEGFVPFSTELVRAAILHWRAKFKDRTWEATSRVLLDGVAPAVVAEELGMSVASVYTAKCRVLSFLRLQLRDLET